MMLEPPFQLRPGIGVARFDDCGIVLDTARDRYWQVSPSTAFALDWLAERCAGPTTPQALDRLAALGLTEPCKSQVRHASPRLPEPQASPLDERAESRAPATLAAEILGQALASIIKVRTIPLAQLIATIERRRQTTIPGKGRYDLITLADAYARYRPLLPIAPRCLPDSVAFLALAHRYGHHPALVFGVTAHPFAAHCWVQTGETILTDQLDHVRAFTPILTI